MAAGLWLGDPDIDAVTRMVAKPTCMGVSAVASAGFVVDPGCYSPFNSQNTGFLRELLPVLLMLTPYGRFDDIWCSYVAERIMREHRYAVHFGQPLVWQQRSAHSLIRDLHVEMEGMEATLRFVSCLDGASLQGDSILDDTARLYEHIADESPESPNSVRPGSVTWRKSCPDQALHCGESGRWTGFSWAGAVR